MESSPLIHNPITSKKSQFLSDILNSSISQNNLTLEPSNMNMLQKRKSSSTNIQLNQNLKKLEEQLTNSSTIAQQHKISLDEALAEAEKLLKTKSLLNTRKEKLENEKIVSISMIASRNLRLKNKEMELRQIEESSGTTFRENLHLKSKLITTTKQVDMLENQLKIKDKEVEQWKNLYQHSKDMIIAFHSTENLVESQSIEPSGTNFLENLLKQESSILEKLNPVNGRVGLMNPMSPHRSKNLDVNRHETTLADQVLKSNLSKIEELTRNENTLQ